MKIYNYNSITKEYIGESEASLDIEATKAEGHNVYYLPANATFTKPPKTLKFEVAVYDNGWQKYEDFRGQYIVNDNMQPVIYSQIGALPEGYIVITEAQANKIKEDDLYYTISDGALIRNPNYDEDKANERKREFESKFLATSKGNYRLQPKGYSNAQQSIDTVNGIVNAIGGLNEEIAQMVIFYPTPDFTKAEQCTEEWLIGHQYNVEPMTKQEWTLYYIEFSKLYAQKQYKQSLERGEVYV